MTSIDNLKIFVSTKQFQQSTPWDTKIKEEKGNKILRTRGLKSTVGILSRNICKKFIWEENKNGFSNAGFKLKIAYLNSWP